MSRSKNDSCRKAEADGNTRKKPARNGRQPESAAPPEDIVETAVAAGSFSTLVKAVLAADLAETLKSEGPFTVFAPVDDAFDRLPEGALAELLEDEDKLATVLSLHMVPGRVESDALQSYAALKTAQGKTLDVDTSIGIKVGTAFVIQADIEASNGMIHAIDSVLLPE